MYNHVHKQQALYYMMRINRNLDDIYSIHNRLDPGISRVQIYRGHRETLANDEQDQDPKN